MKLPVSLFVLVRLIVSILLLIVGIALFQWLSGLKQVPSQAGQQETVLTVPGIRVEPEIVQTFLTGYGTARPRRVVEVAAQVGGKIIEVHPDLDEGRRIAEGELLFQIDPRDTQAMVDQLEAEVARLDNQIDELRQQRRNDERSLEIARRQRDLARREFERFEQLVKIEGVESRSRLDSAELAYRQQEAQVVSFENNLDLYPVRIEAAEDNLAAARARLADARLDLERTTVAAPFTGRVVEKMIELNEVVSPGAIALTFADDSRMEVPIPLEGAEVARWLALDPAEATDHWFAVDQSPEVSVRWSELPGRESWSGRIARVQSYDPRTRTVTLVVVIERPALNRESAAAPFPLVDGMFLEVRIAGRMLADIFRLPREAVTQAGEVLIVNDGRLHTRRVTVVRYQGNEALITEGLDAGDVVLLSRPANVLDGTRVEVDLQRMLSQRSGEEPTTDTITIERGPNERRVP